jgi:hypothetical protein
VIAAFVLALLLVLDSTGASVRPPYRAPEPVYFAKQVSPVGGPPAPSYQGDVPDLIRELSAVHGVDAGTALSVASCETGGTFDPAAYNPPPEGCSGHGCGGVYQQDLYFWPDRAARYGHPGASAFDAYANVDVSLQMATNEGWGHWAGCL